jgi:hypothetical protein
MTTIANTKQVAQETVAHFGNAMDALEDTIRLLWIEQDKVRALEAECDRLWRERNDLAMGRIDFADDSLTPNSSTP